MTRVPPGQMPVRRGPSKRVRRNRAIAVLLFLVIVVIIVVNLAKCSSNQNPAPIPSATQSASIVPDPSSTAGASGIPTASPTGIPTVAGVPVCVTSAIEVTAVTDKTTYAATENPLLGLTIKNVSTAACQVNVGTSSQVFQIANKSKIVWVSTDCQTASADYFMTLQPGQASSSSASIQWQRTASSPDTCTKTNLPKVPVGSYYLTTFIGQAKSAQSASFTLK